MARWSTETKLQSANGKVRFRVYAHEGKRGFNVGVAMKEDGIRAKTGFQSTYETQAQAQAQVDKLVADGYAKGLIPRAGGPKTRRVQFTSFEEAFRLSKNIGAPAPAVSEAASTESPAEPVAPTADQPAAPEPVAETVPASNVTPIGNGGKKGGRK